MSYLQGFNLAVIASLIVILGCGTPDDYNGDESGDSGDSTCTAVSPCEESTNNEVNFASLNSDHSGQTDNAAMMTDDTDFTQHAGIVNRQAVATDVQATSDTGPFFVVPNPSGTLTVFYRNSSGQWLMVHTTILGQIVDSPVIVMNNFTWFFAFAHAVNNAFMMYETSGGNIDVCKYDSSTNTRTECEVFTNFAGMSFVTMRMFHADQSGANTVLTNAYQAVNWSPTPYEYELRIATSTRPASGAAGSSTFNSQVVESWTGSDPNFMYDLFVRSDNSVEYCRFNSSKTAIDIRTFNASLVEQTARSIPIPAGYTANNLRCDQGADGNTILFVNWTVNALSSDQIVMMTVNNLGNLISSNVIAAASTLWLDDAITIGLLDFLIAWTNGANFYYLTLSRGLLP